MRAADQRAGAGRAAGVGADGGVGGGGGFNGYAKTLKLARQRAEYYLNENPWAAPEVLQGELEVLKAVEHEEMNNA